MFKMSKQFFIGLEDLQAEVQSLSQECCRRVAEFEETTLRRMTGTQGMSDDQVREWGKSNICRSEFDGSEKKILVNGVCLGKFVHKTVGHSLLYTWKPTNPE